MRAPLFTRIGFFFSAITASASPAGTSEFDTVLRPFLKEHCTRCHGAERQKGKLRLDTLDGSLASEKSRATWARVAEKLWLGEMPPEDEPRPGPHLTGRVIGWLTASFERAGHRLTPPPALELPGGGNRVSHEALFAPGAGAGAPPPASAARLWRVSPQIYDEMLRGDLGKNARGVTQPFSVLTGEGFKDFSGAFTVDEPTTGLLLRNADAIVASLTRFSTEDGKFKPGPNQPREFMALLDPDSQLSDAQIQAAITKQFKFVLHREPTPDEHARFTAFMRKNVASAGRITGVRTTLAAVLLMPEAIFRMELGAGDADAHGRRMLSPRELAYAISFALTDAPPKGDLQGALDKGAFTASRESAEREVRRMLADPKLAKPRILRFFREFFGYHRAADVFKDDKENKDHDARVLVSDTDRLVEFIVAEDRDVFRELLTTRKAFVNYAFDTKRKTAKRANDGKKQIHLAYGLPDDWQWTPEQPVVLPEGQRAGILTQPSWLVAFSMNFDNHPITRGKWVRERLLGGTVPDIPITVDAQLPNAPEQTLRQRLEVTKKEYCWQCHQRMNPLGLPFEIFDHFGRFRTAERVLDNEATALNVDKKGKPIGPIFKEAPLDTRGIVASSGDARIEGEVNGPLALVRKLADSERVRQVFVRHAFRYWMGRNETLADAPVLQAADRAYVASGGSLNALIVSLLTSDSFLYRTAPPPLVPSKLPAQKPKS